MKSIISNMTSLLKKKETHDNSIIQIGVGGFQSSGKTALIDAMLSCLYDAFCPHYIPPEYKAKLCKSGNDLIDLYDSYKIPSINELKKFVDKYFHDRSRSRTESLGDVIENTYQAKIKIIDKDYILLLRNSPGETFKLFFTSKTIGSANNKSIDDCFKEWFKEYAKNNPGLKIGSLFKTNLDKLKTIEDAFSGYLEHVKFPFDKSKDEDGKFKKYFFDYLFCISSDIYVYCISPDDVLNDDFRECIKALFFSKISVTFCLTQVDRYFSKNNFFDIYDEQNPVQKYLTVQNSSKLKLLKEQKEIDWKKYNDIMIKVYSCIGNLILNEDIFGGIIDDNSTPIMREYANLTDSQGNQTSTSVKRALRDIHEIINKYHSRKELREIFYTSVYLAKRNPGNQKDDFFYDKDELEALNADAASIAQISENILSEKNSGRRMSLGVYELLLHILSNYVKNTVIEYKNNGQYKAKDKDKQSDFFEELTTRIEFSK